jgi:hypothetical protein
VFETVISDEEHVKCSSPEENSAECENISDKGSEM